MDLKLLELSTLNPKDLRKYLLTEDINTLYQLKDLADDLYYNADTDQSSPLNDDQYDMLKDIIMERNPDYKPTVGAQLREGENRVKLPFWLGSMNKFKPGNKDKIQRWVEKNKAKEYIVEDKLDGVSCLLIANNNNISLYTRGDGIIGADISYLAPYFKNIPKKIPENIALRGELIIPINIFEKKYSEEYANPRNMVSGLINAKTIRDGIQSIDFIVYEIVGDSVMPKPSEQLAYLKKLGFKVVRHKLITLVDENTLINTLQNFKSNTPYEIDGIIVQPNKTYIRNTDGNPDYAFAFKVQATPVQTTVTEVLWNVSKWGLLKPRLEIEPVKLGGVTVRYVTGFNAKYIVDNKIGPGSVIAIIRSGDVIPHIVDVIKEANEPQMPDILYKWNKTGVDIIMEKFGPDMCIKLIAGFFNKLGIKQIGEARVKQLYADGLDTLLKIIGASEKRIEQVPGFQKKGAEKIHTNIHNRLQKVSIPLILGSSGIFGMGMGRKRIAALFDGMPNILDDYKTMSKKQLYNQILEIEGFSDITTLSIVDNIEWADKFINALSKYVTIREEPQHVEKTMEGWNIVFTQIRDRDLQEEIESRGGKVMETTPSKNTTMVIVPSTYDNTKKVQKAIELGKPIIKIEDFIKKYIK